MVDYRIKLADSANERDQIYALNYATFVEEIPQHGPNPERRLIDRFDAENEYVVAIDGEGAVVGMLALRANRPFSLDQKLRDLDHYLPPHRSVCEIRLLAVRPSQRHRRIFRDLVAFSARRCIDAGHDLAVISGTTRQLALYGHLGFEPFGPPVGTEAARYQPMFLSIEQFRSSLGDTLAVSRCDEIQGARASFFTACCRARCRAVARRLACAPAAHRAPCGMAATPASGPRLAGGRAGRGCEPRRDEHRVAGERALPRCGFRAGRPGVRNSLAQRVSRVVKLDSDRVDGRIRSCRAATIAKCGCRGGGQARRGRAGNLWGQRRIVFDVQNKIVGR